jgi:hypothetical protein
MCSGYMPIRISLVLSSQVQQATHEILDVQHRVNALLDWCIFRDVHRRHSFHLYLPERIWVGRKRLSGFRISLRSR